MQKLIGLVAIACGCALFYLGCHCVQALNAQVENLLNGTPNIRQMYYYAGGGALVLFGLVQIARKP